jgi:alpha-amylase
MTDICIYFQVHQPHRLRHYTYFDVGHNHDYEDEKANRDIFLKVANKCYLPTTSLLLELIKKYNGAFRVAFSLSGTFIEQAKRFCPEVIDNFKRLVDTGCVELLNETYYHSLSFLFSKDEFKDQVKLHKELIEREFGYVATTFRNTELIYSNELGTYVESLGYNTILAEGADKILGWRSPNYLYKAYGSKNLNLLLRNYRLTDDVAFRFSDRNWVEHPLTAEKYASWLHSIASDANLINLFMDFETFGEHQWEASGIFEFLRHLPEYVLKHPEYKFITPKEASSKYKPVAELDVPYFVSWADEERDLTAWYGNDLQRDALEAVFSLEKAVKASHDDSILATWRLLQTSDHFYYMCIKYASDGDVHKYFNPYNNPYDAYINYQNIISDFSREIPRKEEDKSSVHNETKVKRKFNWWHRLRNFLFANKKQLEQRIQEN